MRNYVTYIIAFVIVAVFATFMLSYSLRFTEAAVVATFNNASGENAVDTNPGLAFRWPYPVQRVTIYDTRARLLEARGETQQTADNRQVIVEAFLTWKIDDPLAFYRRFSEAGAEERDHVAQASDTLRSLLRSALSEVSSYALSDLFTTTGNSSLPELEDAILARLQGADANEGSFRLSDYGIQPLLVGIHRVVLPEETTKQVFERMKATRQRLAAEARSRGQSVAQTITAESESAARRIKSFADRRAESIRVQGDREAQQWYAQLNEAPELAVFLQQLDFLRSFYAKRTTLVLPTSNPGMSIFDPNSVEAISEELGDADSVSSAGDSQ
ncbi:MAG: SPFH domain-containing protein [Phycisphaerales bacterium JB043]